MKLTNRRACLPDDYRCDFTYYLDELAGFTQPENAYLHDLHYHYIIADKPALKEKILPLRETSDFVVYGITNDIQGVYSIAEVADDSNKRPEKTLFLNLYDINADNASKEMHKSLQAVENLLKENDVKVFNSIEDIAEFLNLAANVE